MDIAAALDFVRSHGHAVLATRRKDGSPQLSPVLAAVDDAGHLLISTREPAVKARNARRDPRVSVLVLQDGFFGDWVQLEGSAEVVSLPAALDLLVDYYRRLSGEHQDWDDYRDAMVREQRCVLQITVTAAGPDVAG